MGKYFVGPAGPAGETAGSGAPFADDPVAGTKLGGRKTRTCSEAQRSFRPDAPTQPLEPRDGDHRPDLQLTDLTDKSKGQPVKWEFQIKAIN